MLGRYRFFKYFDWPLLMAVISLIIIGLLAIFSSGQYLFFKKQLIHFFIDMTFFGLICFANENIIKKSAGVFYVLVFLLLLFIVSSGHANNGAQRWLALGGMIFQPSEFAKLAVILMLSNFLANVKNSLVRFINILPIILLVGLPFFVIAQQPDLGTAIVLLIVTLAILFWTDIGSERLLLLLSPIVSVLLITLVPKFNYLVWLIYIGIIFTILIIKKYNPVEKITYFMLNIFSGAFAPIFWFNLAAYQKNRIIAFFNPATDPLARGARYHIVKSIIAVGSGKFFGNGFLHGPLTQLKYIPQQHTDFVFSVIAEEFGFLGSLILMGLFVFIVLRLVKIALQVDSPFGTLVTVGVATMIAFQFIINIGMNIGLFPVVGLPLPFVSYGGSSLGMFLMAIAIVEVIIMRNRRLLF